MSSPTLNPQPAGVDIRYVSRIKSSLYRTTPADNGQFIE